MLAVLSHTEAASSAGARGKLAVVRESVRSFQLLRNQGKLSGVQVRGGSCQLFAGARGKLLAVLNHMEAASSAGARGKLSAVRESVRSFQLFRNQGKLSGVQVRGGSC